MAKPFSFNAPLDGYAIHNADTASATIHYYGYASLNGGWYIMKEDLTSATTPVYTYTSGTSAYATGWTGRAGLTYAAINTAFA